MLTGALLKLPQNLDVNDIDGLTWDRTKNDNPLKSIIQFDGNSFNFANIKVHPAIAIHERLTNRPKLVEESGKYEIGYSEEVVPIWAKCHFSKGFGIVDTLINRFFVLDIIRHGITSKIPVVEYAIDTARIASDHKNHWLQTFSERLGRVDRGTVYGDGVEHSHFTNKNKS